MSEILLVATKVGTLFFSDVHPLLNKFVCLKLRPLMKNDSSSSRRPHLASGQPLHSLIALRNQPLREAHDTQLLARLSKWELLLWMSTRHSS